MKLKHGFCSFTIQLAAVSLVFGTPAKRAEAEVAPICKPADIKIASKDDPSRKGQITGYSCHIGRDDINIYFIEVSGFAIYDLLYYKKNSLRFISFDKFDAIDNEVSRSFTQKIMPFSPVTDAALGVGLHATLGPIERTALTSSFEPDKGRVYKSLLSDSLSDRFPLINTINLLRQGKLPKRLSPFLQKIEGSIKPVDIIYWRDIEIGDLKNYAQDAERYIKTLQHQNSYTQMKPAIPRDIKALIEVFPEGWPSNFVLAKGLQLFEEPGCGGRGDEISNWAFDYHLPQMNVQFAVIQPARPLAQPIDIQVAASDAKPGIALREVADVDAELQVAPATTAARVSDKTVIIPLSIAFDQAPSWPFKMNEINQNRDDVTRAVRAAGFMDEINFRPIPLPKKYIFGPALRVASLTSINQRFDFRMPPNNKISVDISWEAGSCPYLLSQAPNGEWIEHGKVLHNANGIAQRATDARVFQGAVTRFKLEEREAERARIDGVHLRVALRSGGSFTLKPDAPFEAASSDQPLELLWGQGAELNFTLPASIARTDVKETELVVSGYYERYNALLASGEARH